MNTSQDRHNQNEIEFCWPYIAATYKAAKRYALKEYWVSPIQCVNPRDEDLFDKRFKITDRATNGQVHYEKR